MKKLGILLLVFFFACKQKTKEKTPESEPFFPVLSYIKSQVAQVDTSLYSITKINWLDSVRSDTTPVRREEFRGLAKDFFEIPDLCDKKYKDLYTEEKFYDEGLNKVILTYLPKNADTVIIQRQEVLINKGDEGDKVGSFIINVRMVNKDSSVEKKMLWQVDNSFNVVTSVQKPGQAESTTRFKVVWE